MERMLKLQLVFKIVKHFYWYHVFWWKIRSCLYSQTTEVAVRRCSTRYFVPGFNKKETRVQVLSSEFCEIFQNIFLTSRRLLLLLLWRCSGCAISRSSVMMNESRIQLSDEHILRLADIKTYERLLERSSLRTFDNFYTACVPSENNVLKPFTGRS